MQCHFSEKVELLAKFFSNDENNLRNSHFMFRNQFNVSSKKILERSLQFSIIVVNKTKNIIRYCIGNSILRKKGLGA